MLLKPCFLTCKKNPLHGAVLRTTRMTEGNALKTVPLIEFNKATLYTMIVNCLHKCVTGISNSHDETKLLIPNLPPLVHPRKRTAYSLHPPSMATLFLQLFRPIIRIFLDSCSIGPTFKYIQTHLLLTTFTILIFMPGIILVASCFLSCFPLPSVSLIT